jgi:hypothetical protein
MMCCCGLLAGYLLISLMMGHGKVLWETGTDAQSLSGRPPARDGNFPSARAWECLLG